MVVSLDIPLFVYAKQIAAYQLQLVTPAPHRFPDEHFHQSVITHNALHCQLPLTFLPTKTIPALHSFYGQPRSNTVLV